jgi:sigma-B regulation protein RsbU (phosphoserine phosphatase)
MEQRSAPLGMIPETTYEDSEPFALGGGDTVLLVTDGIEEAVSPNGKTLGMQRLINVVRENRNLPAQRIVRAIHDAVLAWIGGRLIQDDLTAVVVKVL